MRITGGSLKGRVIACPEGIIRPAMDRMRESVFAILGDLGGKSFLDLFSGSGTIALEAVSRGAGTVHLCEKDRIKIPTILENVRIAEEAGVRIHCHFMAAELFLRRCRLSFDFIFLDPPFPYKFHADLVAAAARRALLAEGGTILVHRPQEHAMPERVDALCLSDRRTYGRSVVDFYRWQ